MKSIQESKVLYFQLNRQGITHTGAVPVWDGKDQDIACISICSISRTFSYAMTPHSELEGLYTMCGSLTEVMKRLWNTWVEKPKHRMFGGGPMAVGIKPNSSTVVSSIEYYFPIDGTFTEEVTLVSHDKVWTGQWTEEHYAVFKKELLTLMKQVMKRNA